jgi:cytochrome c oxidase assembly factor CtaG
MRRLSAAVLACAAAPAYAHDGHRAAIGWTIGPEVTVPLLVALALFLIGAVRLKRRAGEGAAWLRRSTWLFLAGWTVLAAALVSPLHAAGEVSFAMHMIEHETIMLPAALLLVAARPGPVLLWGLPRPLRRALAPLIRLGLWRALARPVAATAIQAAALVLWHTPALFDRALRSDALHIAQHLSFLASALLFWWAMLPREPTRAGRLVAALCLFVTSLIGGGLGALMAFDASPWYAGYVALGMTPFGLDPVADQQLAGLIMWVPGGAFHLAAALIALAASLRSAPQGLDHRVARGRQPA